MSAAVTSGVVNGLDNSVDVSFLRYPPHRPFINSSYQRSPSKAVMSYPETNRDGKDLFCVKKSFFCFFFFNVKRFFFKLWSLHAENGLK